jgi:hypothetical protein
MSAEDLERRLAFPRQLHEAFAELGIRPRLVVERPEEWRLGPLTAAVDRAADTAVLRYARQPVAVKLRCDAAVIAAAYRRVCERLIAQSMDPERLFASLEAAYRAVLERRGAAAGARAPIAEICAELAAAAGPKGARRRASRAQLSFDIARLRGEGELSRAGRRLDFGVATGGIAARKREVLWIEDESGSGHYYATLRLLPEPGPEPTIDEPGTGETP